MARGRHVRNRRFGVVAVLATVAAFALLAAGGAAFGAYRYEQARERLILPGVEVAGIDVGNMTRREAVRAVRAAASEWLAEPLKITVDGDRWTSTPADLGEKAVITGAVDEALALNQTMGTLDRFWHRVREDPVELAVDIEYRTSGRGVEDFVSRIAERVFVPWTNASIGTTPGEDDITFLRSAPGRKLDVDEATSAIRAALAEDREHVQLETVRLEPKTTGQTMGPTIVVRVDENKLYLYEGFDVVKTWSVATAKPGWITPTGVWNIWDKRVNPTWYNPALDSWGADLPAVVPGGPSAPMGTRAIYIDAPGLIRIHGTPAPESIGRYASHGCIRMRNEEVEELFEMIPVGADVVVVGHRPAGAMEGDTPAQFDI